MAFVTRRRCPKCGDVNRRSRNICGDCERKAEEAKEAALEQELEDLKQLSIEERLARIEKWMQGHRGASHYVPPRRYG